MDCGAPRPAAKAPGFQVSNRAALQPILGSEAGRLISSPQALFDMTLAYGSPLNIVLSQALGRNVDKFRAVLRRHDVQCEIFYGAKVNRSPALVRAGRARLRVSTFISGDMTMPGSTIGASIWRSSPLPGLLGIVGILLVSRMITQTPFSLYVSSTFSVGNWVVGLCYGMLSLGFAVSASLWARYFEQRTLVASLVRMTWIALGGWLGEGAGLPYTYAFVAVSYTVAAGVIAMLRRARGMTTDGRASAIDDSVHIAREADAPAEAQ